MTASLHVVTHSLSCLDSLSSNSSKPPRCYSGSVAGQDTTVASQCIASHPQPLLLILPRNTILGFLITQAVLCLACRLCRSKLRPTKMLKHKKTPLFYRAHARQTHSTVYLRVRMHRLLSTNGKARPAQPFRKRWLFCGWLLLSPFRCKHHVARSFQRVTSSADSKGIVLLQAIAQYGHILSILAAVGHQLGVDEFAAVAVGWTVHTYAKSVYHTACLWLCIALELVHWHLPKLHSSSETLPKRCRDLQPANKALHMICSGSIWYGVSALVFLVPMTPSAAKLMAVTTR